MLKFFVADLDPVPLFKPGSGIKKLGSGDLHHPRMQEVGPPFLNIDGLEAGGPNGFLHVARGEGALLAHNPVDFCSHTVKCCGTGTCQKSGPEE